MSDNWMKPFLRDRRVAVLSIPRTDRAPLTTPVWYDYDGARFLVQVESGSAKAKALAGKDDTAVALTIQSEVPPYRYVVIYGTASLQPNGQPGLRRKLAHRYFGRLAGNMYVEQEEQRGVNDASLRVIEILPQRTIAHDFHPEAGLFGRFYFAIYRWFRPVRA